MQKQHGWCGKSTKVTKSLVYTPCSYINTSVASRHCVHHYPLYSCVFFGLVWILRENFTRGQCKSTNIYIFLVTDHSSPSSLRISSSYSLLYLSWFTRNNTIEMFIVSYKLAETPPLKLSTIFKSPICVSIIFLKLFAVLPSRFPVVLLCFIHVCELLQTSVKWTHITDKSLCKVRSTGKIKRLCIHGLPEQLYLSCLV